MATKQERVKALWEVTLKTYTEVFAFNKITTAAYKTHYQRQFRKDEREEVSNYHHFVAEKAKTLKLPPIVHKTSIIYGVSAFEVFFKKFLIILYQSEPRALKNSSRTLTYEEILNCSTMKSLQSKMIATILHDFFYKSIAEQIDLVTKKFGFKFKFNAEKSTIFDTNINIERLTEIFSLRNIILHNDSEINEIFVEKNPTSKYKLGDKLVFQAEDTLELLYYLLQIVTKLSYQVLGEKKKK
ncbi:MAG: hypothetical protein JWP69_578 [Flaviaesturariibacter sp.]|nr:hypothetical protein [Flaviaesturariibacter sp.]